MSDVVAQLGETRRFLNKEPDHQIEWQRLRQDFIERIPEGGRILDVGVGSGEDSRFFESKGFRVVSADLQGRKLDSTSTPVVMDLAHLGFADQSFDAVWLANVVIFVDDNLKRKAFETCSNILNRNGTLFVCDNFFPSDESIDSLMEPQLGDEWHTSKRVHNMVEESGFKIVDEKIGIDIPEKRGFADKRGFHTMLATKD